MNRLFKVFSCLCAILLGASAVSASGLPAAPPESLGLSPERLARIDALLQRYVDRKELAGVAIAIARNGKVGYFRSAGMADIAANRPMRDDTLVRIYSMSKPITAVAALILIEEGRLRLDDELSMYLPEFKDVKVFAGEGPDGIRTEPAKRPILVRDLFTHTSGMTYGGAAMDASPVGKLYADADLFRAEWSLDQFSRAVAALPLSRQPGGDFLYGVSTDILGRLVEVVSGQSFDLFLKERIFDPLKMADTSFTVPPAKVGRLAELYRPIPGGGVEREPNEATHARFRDGARLFSGGGGLVSTVGDYLRFCQMLLNGGELDGARILSPKTVKLMTAVHVPLERAKYLEPVMPGYGFGLGVAVLVDPRASRLAGSVGEYNWAGAANTFFFIDPQEKLIAVLSTQLLALMPYPLHQELRTLVYQSLEETYDAD